MWNLKAGNGIDRAGLIVRWTISLIVPVGILTFAGSVSAQPPGVGVGPGITRPTTSPYLNLLQNNGFSPALNYYRLVRPETELRRYSDSLNRQVTGLRQDLTSRGLLPDGSHPLSGTGHATSFLNTGGFFPGSRTALRR